jgi:MoaA/NifB/PqqE/SkfB family radical SAM enzyme
MLSVPFFKKSYPALDWIQVEITSYCNADCVYCPHTAYRKGWQNRYLPLKSFQNLIPALSKSNLIYLQGWGEPFIHPDFMDMLRLSKKAGCRVGSTSNATLLNESMIEKMVAAGLDVIGFSLAGINKQNDRIRKGTSIEKVLKCIETIHRVKKRLGTRRPMIHIAYMLLHSGLTDLEQIPTFLADIGADQTVISSLSLIVNRDLAAEAMLASSKEEYLDLKGRLQSARDLSLKKGVEVHFHVVTPFKAEIDCSENIQRALVVGSDGAVSPCVFTQIPTSGPNAFFYNGQKQLQQNLSFGNINEKQINHIWHAKDYKRFRQAHFTIGKPKTCQHCYKGKIDETL